MYRLSKFELRFFHFIFPEFEWRVFGFPIFDIRNLSLRSFDFSNSKFEYAKDQHLRLWNSSLWLFEFRSSIVYFWFSEFPISNFRIWNSSLRSFELSTSEFECSIFEIRTSPSSGDASNVRLCVCSRARFSYRIPIVALTCKCFFRTIPSPLWSGDSLPRSISHICLRIAGIQQLPRAFQRPCVLGR